MEVPFIGPSYLARSKTIDAERSINLYPEISESDTAKTKVSLISVPGKTLWFALPTAPLRAMWVVPGVTGVAVDRLFVVGGIELYEVFQNGTAIARGALTTLGGLVCMENNTTQLMITDATHIYILNLETLVFTRVPTGTPDNQGNPNAPLAGNTCAFLDDYLITHQNGTNLFGLSDLGDGLSWDGLDQAEKEGSPDAIVAVVTAHRELFILGQYTTEVWYDVGGAGFPLSPIQGVFLENGLVGPFAFCKADNTIFWVSYDKKGWAVVNRLNGYVPQRISTHAIEKMINDLGSVPQCNIYSYQEEGHTFVVLNFPNAPYTLVYDAASTFWHERQSIGFGGLLSRDRAGFHAFAFGRHILGDFQNGNLYNPDLDVQVDYDQPLRRIRIAPHLHADLNYTFFKTFQVDMETGVGLDGSPAVGADPQAVLKISNDGGRSWGNERYSTLGKIGQNIARARWTNLGRARDRVYWFEVSDPVKVALVAAYSDHEVGTS